MKILLLDIETSPNLAHVWGIWQQNVGLPQLLESSKTICYSAKWLGGKEIYFDSIYQSKEKKMLNSIWNLMDEADAIVHYNGLKFDIPTLNRDFLLNGMKPPSPAKQIDLLQVVKKQFKFVSNKLDYVSQQLGLGKKTQHEGHELWIKCLDMDRQAWKTMEEYNRNDVVLLEKVYNKVLPWIKSHISYSAYYNSQICPNCGSDHVQKRGTAVTRLGTYQRYQCQDCGHWSRGNKNESKGEKLVTVV